MLVVTLYHLVLNYPLIKLIKSCYCLVLELVIINSLVLTMILRQK